MSFTLSEAVNPPTVFLALLSELGDRFDPEMVLFRRKVHQFKYPVRKLRSFFCESPQYGAGERGLERESAEQARYVRITDIDEYGILTEELGANHLHLIEESSSADLIAIFDKVLASRKRTVFVSMPFGKEKPDDHYAIIQRVCREVSESHNLKPALKVERVDWFHDGTSYEINDKIIEMMSDCGLLIGNLTHCNPNVYHEVGFVMGKAKAEGKDVANMLLFLDESVAEDKDKFVGFNLRGIKQLRFDQPELEFAPALRENLERFFKLKV